MGKLARFGRINKRNKMVKVNTLAVAVAMNSVGRAGWEYAVVKQQKVLWKSFL